MSSVVLQEVIDLLQEELAESLAQMRVEGLVVGLFFISQSGTVSYG